MKKKIIIYDQTLYAGGTLVMAALCKTLREQGYDARVLFTHRYQNEPNDRDGSPSIVWRVLIKTWLSHLLQKFIPNNGWVKRWQLCKNHLTTMDGIKIQYNPFFCRWNTIVVYPETLYGNPLYAKNVVRWLLYFHRFKDVDGAFGENELVVAYRKVFNDKKLNPNEYLLNISFFDNKLYHQYNFGKRNDNCYIIRKGKERKDLPSSFDGPCVDFGMDEDNIVKIFNEHKYCYSYDTQTFYCTIAAVCGCIPIVVLEPNKTKKDYLSSDDKTYGVAYGSTPSEVKYAIETREQCLKQLDYTEHNHQNVAEFVKLLERRFGELKR